MVICPRQPDVKQNRVFAKVLCQLDGKESRLRSFRVSNSGVSAGRNTTFRIHRPPIDVEKVTADVADDREDTPEKPPRKEYPEKHRGRDTLGAIRDANRDKLVNAPSSGAFWKEIKRLADPKPDPVIVTAEALRGVFEKRLNPPIVVPSAFDEIQHKINMTLASQIPEHTLDETPERFFSAQWNEDDGAWVKDHLLNHALDSASGEDGTTYADILDIPNEDLSSGFYSVTGNWSTRLQSSSNATSEFRADLEAVEKVLEVVHWCEDAEECWQLREFGGLLDRARAPRVLPQEGVGCDGGAAKGRT
ncbi:hypothetical protein DFH06DRAFT_1123206 [Mycena polygramma]|nr:hypothetical protein DFH06DRAFT_1123206 [Mycena polygramma]